MHHRVLSRALIFQRRPFLGFSHNIGRALVVVLFVPPDSAEEGDRMTIEGLRVRRAEVADLPVVLEMVHALARHHDDQPAATLQSLDADVAWGTIFLVACAGGEIVGYAALLPLAQIQFGRRGLDIHHMFVRPAFRGQHVGRALIDAGRDVARVAGCEYVMVGTHPENFAAQAVYRACGFSDAPIGGPRFGMRVG
jgi:GNAT superfamily N-acetyltransferase